MFSQISKQKILYASGVIAIALAVLLTVFSSCKKTPLPSYSKSTAETAAPRLMMKTASNAVRMEAPAVYSDLANDTVGSESDKIFSKEAAAGEIQTKKIIRTGNVHLEVESLADTNSTVEQWVKKFGGYISNTNEDSRNIYICAHIPSKSFDEAFGETGTFGKLVSKNISSRDVSDQYYDLEGRLNTQKTLLKKMNEYLKNAKDMNDILKIESKISTVTNEIERMTGQMNRLSKQIDYSQIDISANLPMNQNESGFILPDTKSKAREFIGNVLEFFSSFIFNILYILIFGTAVSLLVVFIYWIAFGKIGLLRRLFKKIV